MSTIVPPKNYPTPWQARQAAMLYEYSSLDYLKKLLQLVTQLIDGVVDPVLTVAASQDRDALLRSSQWGNRNTSENWANNAWPFLKELQASLAKDIAMRAFGKYEITAVNECLRGADQFSMQWATEEEEKQYVQAIALINWYSSRIDKTMFPQRVPRWNDFRFASVFGSFKASSPRIPKFHIRTDLVGQTGKMPPRTGVYVAADDNHAALQFAATGPGGIELREASTFNALGHEALTALGRDNLWFNEEKMLEFASQPKHIQLFRSSMEVDGQLLASLAPSAVAVHSFTTHPSKWYFVEIIPDEYEDVELLNSACGLEKFEIRLAGGEVCQSAGFYFTPSRANSRRHFKAGETVPEYSTEYGKTIWQWDPNQ